MTTQPRLFRLQRDHDVSGVSGTGHIADGVLWPDGTVTLRWIGDRPSTVHWDRLSDAVAIHGHNGATRIVWADEQPPAELPKPGEPIVQASKYSVNCLPEDGIDSHVFEITVEYRGHGRWAVKRHSQCLGSDGTWEYEMRPSEREDEWLDAHRFDL
uniref:hypothetical protein n=4 Tax=Bacteria TaxID=2 RepID=UPI0035D9AFEB